MPKPSIGDTAPPVGMGGKKKDAFNGSEMQTHETRLSNRRNRELSAWGAAGEWQECNVPCTLDGYRDRALVSRAGSQLATWLNLAALANVAAKPTDILVVDVSDVVCAVLADLTA